MQGEAVTRLAQGASVWHNQYRAAREAAAISDHVYFFLDRSSPPWPEFSTASAIGMHFSGDWPELQLELWAILESRR